MRRHYRTAGALLLGLSKSATNSQVPLRWEIHGRTNLRNRPNLREDRQRMKGGGSTGVYTMARSWRTAVALAKTVGKVGKSANAYLVTHTMGPQYDEQERRNRWNRFLHTMRQRGMVSYFWVTERHTGQGPNWGTIHHHAVLVFDSPWWYRHEITRLSYRYAGSTNGLDVRPVLRSAAAYVVKYVCKGAFGARSNSVREIGTGQDLSQLPFRWWGCSTIPRGGVLWFDPKDADYLYLRSPWYDGGRVWTSTAITSDCAADLVWDTWFSLHSVRRINQRHEVS